MNTWGYEYFFLYKTLYKKAIVRAVGDDGLHKKAGVAAMVW